MFIVDKTPYKYLAVSLSSAEAYAIQENLMFNKIEGWCTQLLAAVSGDANAQVKWRSDPETGSSAQDGMPLLQYGTLELKNMVAIKNLRFYCVSTATLHLILMR